MTDELTNMNLQPKPMPQSMAKVTQSAQEAELELQQNIKAIVDSIILTKPMKHKQTGEDIDVPCGINMHGAVKKFVPRIPIVAHSSLGMPYEYHEESGTWSKVASNLSEHVDRYYLEPWLDDWSDNPSIYRDRKQLSRDIAGRLTTIGEDLPLLEVANPEKILFRNGSYNFDTNTIEPPRKEDYHTIQLPYNLIPNDEEELETERWLKWVVGDSLKTVKQIIGYCFYRQYKTAMFTYFINDPRKSSGANGKSQVLQHIQHMLGGTDNVSTVPLDLLTSKTDRFSRAQLQHKLANIDADSGASYLEETGILKRLTGDDLTQAEFKGKDSFSFRNYAKLIFSTNKLPRFSDDSHGMQRRITVVPFVRDFSDKSMTPELAEEMVQFNKAKAARRDYNGEEIGKFAWKCIQEYRALLQGDYSENGFYKSDLAIELTKGYLDSNDIVKQFLNDHNLEITKDSDDRVIRAEVRDMFTEWKNDTEAKIAWGIMQKKLVEHGVELKRARIRVKNGETKNTQCFVGLKLKEK